MPVPYGLRIFTKSAIVSTCKDPEYTLRSLWVAGNSPTYLAGIEWRSGDISVPVSSGEDLSIADTVVRSLPEAGPLTLD